MKDQLKMYLEKYVQIDPNELNTIYASMERVTFSKNAFLVCEGNVCTAKYFILKGLVRSFYIDAKGNEKITQFSIENWWVTDLESFLNNTPSNVSIQALETTSVLKIDKHILEHLYFRIPKLERVFRMITENMLIAFQRKHEHYLKMKSKERFTQFVQTFPDFFQRVPQYMIASYLEITPEYLSSLRK